MESSRSSVVLDVQRFVHTPVLALKIQEECPTASRSTSPEPGSPRMEVCRVSSAKRLGDDVVHLEERTANTQSGVEAFPDFPQEFDPLAGSRSRTSRHGSERSRVELDDIFSAFKTSEELQMLDRQPLYVEKLPAADIQNSLDQIFPMPPKDDPDTKKQVPAHLIAELPQAFSLQPLTEDCNLDAPSIPCSLEKAAARPRHLEATLPRHLEAALPRHLEAALPAEAAQGSHRRGRSLDASIPAGPVVHSNDPPGCVAQPHGTLFEGPPCEQDRLSAARRGRSTDDSSRDVRQRSWHVDCQPQPVPQDLLQLQPMRDIPLVQQVQELQLQPLQTIPPAAPQPEVQAKSDVAYQRFMRDGDNLLAWDMPGQAYLKYCEANSQHDGLCGHNSGDAYRGMARSLSAGAGFPGLVSGLPNTAEERLDLGMNMLELAVQAGSTKLGDARSDPKLENLRKLRSARFMALMEQVPATGLDALAVAASAGVAAMAAAAGIQPVALVPVPSVPMVPYAPEPAPTTVFLDPSQAASLVEVPRPAGELAAIREVQPAQPVQAVQAVQPVQPVQQPQEESQDEEDEDDEDEEEEDEEADGDGEDEDEGDGEEDSDEEGEKVEEADSEDEASDSDASANDEGAASESDAEGPGWAESLRNLFGW
ncbi:unnamed protein product [Symbiodinium natans]|uniref:Uncharacterized protein n=1 Tax=Symbiodinium natans TaxID=878477 RepID=A0A812NT56_9DINO|nr:unnamed protein product [Symbiodinium natans]